MSEPYYDEGGITIYHGDCLDVLPTLEAVDHVITDPPFARDVYMRAATPRTKVGSGTPARMGATLAKLAVGEIGWIDELRAPVAAEIARLTARWALVFSDVETAHLWRADLESAGMRYVRTGAWVKVDPMPQMSGDRPGVGFEACVIAHAQGPMRWNGGGHAALWTFKIAKGAARPAHPTPKPLPLMRRLIDQFTDPGDTILDPFMGSGTTLRAAADLGRRAIGIERHNEIGEDGVDRRYCEMAARRMAQRALSM